MHFNGLENVTPYCVTGFISVYSTTELEVIVKVRKQEIIKRPVEKLECNMMNHVIQF